MHPPTLPPPHLPHKKKGKKEGKIMCDIMLFATVIFYCPGMVESLHQHVNENFQKQTPSIQEMLRIRLLRLRVALCSIIPSGRQRAAECRALLTFFSISYVLRTIVRPKSATAQEKVSCDQVANISNDNRTFLLQTSHCF